MEVEPESVCEAFLLICNLHEALGMPPLNSLPGLWRHDVDETWSFDVNGQTETLGGLPPYHARIYRGDRPVGLMSPRAGTMAEPDTEDVFIDALRTAITKAGGEPDV